jgi:hypothetical protein
VDNRWCRPSFDIVTGHLKGEIVEPEEVAADRQGASKHAPTATNMDATREELKQTSVLYAV